jgi:hypothetical protein
MKKDFEQKRSVVVLVVMQKLGIEPRFSRPQRDVLTTGRFLPDEPKHRADFDETALVNYCIQISNLDE